VRLVAGEDPSIAQHLDVRAVVDELPFLAGEQARADSRKRGRKRLALVWRARCARQGDGHGRLVFSCQLVASLAAIGQLPPVKGRTPRDRRMRTRIRAPEARRIAVNVAASIAVSRNAILHSSELLAKASMASAVRRAVRRLKRTASSLP